MALQVVTNDTQCLPRGGKENQVSILNAAAFVPDSGWQSGTTVKKHRSFGNCG